MWTCGAGEGPKDQGKKRNATGQLAQVQAVLFVACFLLCVLLCCVSLCLCVLVVVSIVFVCLCVLCVLVCCAFSYQLSATLLFPTPPLPVTTNETLFTSVKRSDASSEGEECRFSEGEVSLFRAALKSQRRCSRCLDVHTSLHCALERDVQARLLLVWSEHMLSMSSGWE